MNKSIKALATFTDILKSGDVEEHMEQIKNCCNTMSKTELQNALLEMITSVYMNCRMIDYMRVFEDVAIELDERYDKQYQV